MKKKLFTRVLPMLLAMCLLLSTTAFGATTYYIDLSITGPDARGVEQTVTSSSSKFGLLTSPLAYEVVQVINAKVDAFEKVYDETGLGQIVYEGLNAFSIGEAAWHKYLTNHKDDIIGDFKETLYDLESTFADINVDESNELIFYASNGNPYYVTVTLREYQIGSSDADCSRGEDCPAAKFADLDLYAWYHDGIHYCVSNNLMAGYSDSAFGPNDNLTRAQIANILYNLEGKPAVETKDIFADVKASDWFANAVVWASDAGVVTGYGNANFGPEDYITREQLAVMLYRYSQFKGYDVSDSHEVELVSYTDNDLVSDWAKVAVKWATTEDVIEGQGECVLNPAGFATRAQAATVFMRFCLNCAK